jgi:hypothetical protein
MLFKVWNIEKARPAGKPTSSKRQAWDRAYALEAKTRKPYTVVCA